VKTPKLAIIGCGAVAQRYYAPALEAFPRVRDSVILVDRDRRSGEALRKILGAGELYTDHREVLEKADGAVVLVPHHLHHAVTMDFLDAGLPVLCEKPLAVSLAEARDMVGKAREKGVALCVNNTRRLFPSFRAVHGIIRSGDLGRLERIVYKEGNAFGWPSATGFYVNPALSPKGILLDLGSHVMDTLSWWAGGRPELVECLDDSYGGPESVVRLTARFGECSLEVVLNRLCELSNTYEVVLGKGRLEGRINDWKRLVVRHGSGAVQVKKLPCGVSTYPGFVKPVLENFLRVLEGAEAPLVSGSDVLDSIDLIDECYRGRKRFPSPWDRGVSPAAVEVSEERRVLVTGAAGFIGGRVVEMIHQGGPGGLKVRAGVRQWSSAARLGRMPAETALVDVLDRKGLRKALDGITHVIHCAKGTPEATVTGTRNLAEACLAKGIRHFVHLSTAEVYGNASGVVDETRPFHYTGNGYNGMKIGAERACWQCRERGLHITVLRPAIVYGPFSSSWSLRFASLFLAGEWGLLEGYGEGTCNLVYVDDLVDTILHVLDHRDAFGRAFNINGPEVVTWNRYFTLLNNGMGLPPLRTLGRGRAGALAQLTDPVRSLGGFVKSYLLKPVKKTAERFDLFDAALRRTEHAMRATPSREELRLFSRDVLYSDALARKTLPRCPGTSVKEGVGHTVEWLRYLGLVGPGGPPAGS